MVLQRQRIGCLASCQSAKHRPHTKYKTGIGIDQASLITCTAVDRLTQLHTLPTSAALHAGHAGLLSEGVSVRVCMRLCWSAAAFHTSHPQNAEAPITNYQSRASGPPCKEPNAGS
jgi:hypothetical protein